MSIKFTADEALKMAEKIKRGGIEFYRSAAKGVRDAETRKVLLELAELEEKHRKVFADLRDGLTEEQRRTIYAPEESEFYMRAVHQGEVFDTGGHAASLIAAAKSTEEILRTAMSMEKDCLIFYVTVVNLLPPGYGKDEITGLLNDEQRHIGMLSNALASLKKGR